MRHEDGRTRLDRAPSAFGIADAGRESADAEVHRQAIFWTIPVLLVVIFLTFMMMRQIGGQPVPPHRARRARGVQRNLERKFHLDEPWYVQYALLRQGRLHVRPRPVARPPRPRR